MLACIEVFAYGSSKIVVLLSSTSSNMQSEWCRFAVLEMYEDGLEMIGGLRVIKGYNDRSIQLVGSPQILY